MARMIPPTISALTRSPGEREVFERFRSDPETKDWVVLHSLDLAEHRRQIAGEIDFVVLIPNLGVLCLEVKAHKSVKREEDGRWFLGNDLPSPVGPFKQASEAMHSLRANLVKRRPSLRNVVFWSAVCFTRAPFESDARAVSEWHPWQVIDAATFRRRPISQSAADVLREARAHIASKPSARWFHPESREPTKSQIAALADTLRPKFEFFETPQSRVHQLNQELVVYTNEQLSALDAMDSAANPRVVFEGPAGTGKTLLALEETRRGAARNERVFLCCFNRLLGSWLLDQTEPLGDEVVASTLHSFMLCMARVEPPADAKQSFWETELPELALQAALEDSNINGEFDLLVVDEAQDILQEPYLDLLDAVLRGGLSGGKWRLFGDFTRQSIYRSTPIDPGLFPQKRAPNCPRYQLKKNCRNPPRVVSYLELLAGLRGEYSSVLRPDNEIQPRTLFYSDPKDQVSQIQTLVDELNKEGYSSDEMVVLSPRRADSAISRITDKRMANRFCDAANPVESKIRYCTAHSFKGLESTVVILTDVEDLSRPEAESLFYVAVSRATERVYVLASERVRSQIIGKLVPERVPQ